MDGNQGSKTVIGADIEIVGSVKCASDIQVNGKLNGDLTCNGSAVIGESATIKGNITVDSITVMGQINGNITAKDRIEMKATTRLNGDIRAKRLTVEDGVSFVGKSEVNPTAAPGARQPEQKAAPESAPADGAEETGEDAKNKTGVFGRK